MTDPDDFTHLNPDMYRLSVLANSSVPTAAALTATLDKQFQQVVKVWHACKTGGSLLEKVSFMEDASKIFRNDAALVKWKRWTAEHDYYIQEKVVSLHLEQAHHHRGEFRKHTKVERGYNTLI